jgi:hypothetical protein
VYNKDEQQGITWEKFASVKEIRNDITEIGTLRMGFDDELYNFKFEDITFKVLNDTGLWDEILSQETVAEIRIVYSSFSESNKCREYRGEFYGIIDKTSITHSNDVDPADAMWGKYREYDFTALNYLCGLREVSILELREALKNKVINSDFSFLPNIKHGLVSNIDFIRVDDVIKTAIELIYTGDIEVSVKSEIEFSSRFNAEAADAEFMGTWYLDTSKPNNKSITMIFKRYPSTGPTCNDTFWDGDGFDNNEENKTKFTFFNYENSLVLLKDLMLYFGLVWYIRYELNLQELWKFKVYFNLCPRDQNKLPKNLNSEIYDGIDGGSEKQKSGVTVSVLDSVEVANSNINIKMRRGTTNGSETTNKRELTPSPKADNVKLSTSIMSFYVSKDDNADTQKNILGQSLYGFLYDQNKELFFTIPSAGISLKNPGMLPLNRYSVTYPSGKQENYPLGNREGIIFGGDTRPIGSTRSIFHTDPLIYRSYFGEMIANYYAGQYGIYSSIKSVLKFTIDTLDVQPLDVISIAGKKYIVMQVEKDFIDGNSKLELKEY